MKLRHAVRPSRGARVSIHTRHHWRVKHGVVRRLAAEVAVSIHTRHHWRVKHLGANLVPQAVFVSIHTRHHWRVKLADVLALGANATFQSTPAITGG